MTGEMSLEKRLVDRDRFYPGHLGFTFEPNDPVDHQKWKPMGQNLHDLIGIERAIAERTRLWSRERLALRAFAGKRARQFGIGAVTRLYRNDMSPDSLTDQSKVADDIENLVTNEFVLEPQRFLAHYGIAANNDRIFKTAALDQIFFHQGLNVFIVNKGSRRRDFPFENPGCDFHRK